MNSSEEQFPELIANLIARAEKSLRETQSFSPIGLAILQNNSIEVVICAEIDDFGERLNLIQNQLKEHAASGKIKACSISYADYQNGYLVSFLENKDNYCLKVQIPVVVRDTPELDVSNIESHDGTVYVFGESHGT